MLSALEGGHVLAGGTDLRLFAVDLLGLLKWRSNTNLLQQNLRQLMKVDGGEVVKVRRPAALGALGHVGMASRVAGLLFRTLPQQCPGACRAALQGQNPPGTLRWHHGEVTGPGVKSDMGAGPSSRRSALWDGQRCPCLFPPRFPLP